MKWLCGLVVLRSNGEEMVLFIFYKSYVAFCLKHFVFNSCFSMKHYHNGRDGNDCHQYKKLPSPGNRQPVLRVETTMNILVLHVTFCVCKKYDGSEGAVLLLLWCLVLHHIGAQKSDIILSQMSHAYLKAARKATAK